MLIGDRALSFCYTLENISIFFAGTQGDDLRNEK